MEFGTCISIQIRAGSLVNKCIPFVLLMIISHEAGAQQLFQLAPPVIKYHAVFYKKQQQVEIKFDQPGTAVYYTLNNREPNPADSLYRKPVMIKGKITVFKARAFGKAFLPSETAAVTFLEEGVPVSFAGFSKPDSLYPGSGPRTLIDAAGGNLDIHASTWLGYRSDTIEINILLEKEHPVSQITLGFLRDDANQVFLPEKIEAAYFNAEEKNYIPFATEMIFSSEAQEGARYFLASIYSNTKLPLRKIKIIINPVSKIPSWHPGKGLPAWCFLDEVKVY